VKNIRSIKEIEGFIDAIPQKRLAKKSSMKKARRMTRRTLSILAVTIVAISIIGMGAVVNYISNQTKATVSVDSPIEICTIDDSQVTGWSDWGESYEGVIPGYGQDWVCEGNPASIDLGDICGGGSVSYWLRVTNLANGVIESHLSFYINCNEGLTKTSTDPLVIGDFEKISVTVYDWDPAGPTEREVIIDDVFDTTTYPGDYQMDGAGHLLIWFESYLFPAGNDGDQYFVKIDIEFANGAHGNYALKTQMLEDPTDWS
jgi:hypothetical protein